MGASQIDKLKELNLESMEEPRPVYVSTMLTPKEKESISGSSLKARMYLHEIERKCLD